MWLDRIKSTNLKEFKSVNKILTKMDNKTQQK